MKRRSFFARNRKVCASVSLFFILFTGETRPTFRSSSCSFLPSPPPPSSQGPKEEWQASYSFLPLHSLGKGGRGSEIAESLQFSTKNKIFPG